MSKIISLDAMGGDYGPQVLVPAGLAVLKKHPDLKLIFIGLEEILEPLLRQMGKDLERRWEIQHAQQKVEMDELPAQALRYKKDSSMRVAIDLVKEGRAQACVSAGNTGALMATARFVLKTLPGIDRPAIIARFPTREKGKEVYLLDLGANVDSTAQQLYQFALMGSTMVSTVYGIESPRVGLLNIGEEQIKGNEQVKKTAELLSKHSTMNMNYVGYIEGDGIFSGEADVVVCDGFVGNVVLKACEGASKLIVYYAKQAFKKSWLSRLAVLPTLPILKNLSKQLDPRRRNGATLIGLRGIIVKSHGGADVLASTIAIEEALLEVEKNLPACISERLSKVL